MRSLGPAVLLIAIVTVVSATLAVAPDASSAVSTASRASGDSPPVSHAEPASPADFEQTHPSVADSACPPTGDSTPRGSGDRPEAPSRLDRGEFRDQLTPVRGPLIADPGPDDERSNRSSGAIVAVYPDPVEPNDRGEYAVVEYPPGAGWTLSDGETRVRLPGAAGRAVVTADPDALGAGDTEVVDVGYEEGIATGGPLSTPVGNPDRDHTPPGTIVVASGLRFANGGETLRLRHGGTVVDEVTYENAPEGEILWPGIDKWRPVGATNFDPVTAGPARAEAFVLPDGPGVVTRTLRAADRRVLLGGYTFSSWRVARALVAARERGARVRVLVDGSPVGGTTRRQARILDWLVANDVAVSVLAGPRARYDFHHAKYAVVDDRALVLTENYKPAGTGGRASRGWGAVVDDPETAAHLADVFRADTGWRDTTPWTEFRADRSFEPGGAANGSYPARFAPAEVSVDRAGVLVAPDNAEAGIVDAVRGAEESVLVQQVSIGGRDQPFLRATIDAARRGVRVRVLLSSAWYVREDNRELAEWLNDLASREGLPLEARLAEPRSRYAKIHAKGAVTDEETVVLGSVNWNNNSARENREVAVVLEGEEVGRYYARAIRADWRGGTRQVPAGVVGAVVLAAAGGLRAARDVSFERP